MLIRSQKPAAQLLVQPVQAIAHRSLLHLRHQGLRVTHQHVFHRADLFEIGHQDAGPDAKSVPGILYNRLVQHCLATHEKRNADNAVVADERHLGGFSFARDVQQRDDR